MTLEEFKEYLDELRTIIVNGIACFSAWQAIANLNESEAQALNEVVPEIWTGC